MEGPPQLSIRPASVEDLPRLAQIERTVHVAPWSQENFQSELEKPYSQILLMTDDETDTRIAGYIVFWQMFDESQILNLAVDLPFRGLGIAKSLVRKVAAVGLRKGSKRILLEVRKSNQPAQQLYHSLGFTICQIRKQFYSNGEDAYQMVLELEGQKIDF